MAAGMNRRFYCGVELTAPCSRPWGSKARNLREPDSTGWLPQADADAG